MKEGEAVEIEVMNCGSSLSEGNSSLEPTFTFATEKHSEKLRNFESGNLAVIARIAAEQVR